MHVKFGGNEVHLFGTQLKVGDTFPEFTLTDNKLDDLESKEMEGAKVVITFPSVDFSVSSLELLVFNDKLEDHQELRIFGVSMDLPFAQKKWAKDNAGDYITMLSDHKFRVFGEVTGTYIEELGFLTVATFVVNKDNIITYAHYETEIGKEPDYDRVIEEAEKVM